MRKKATGQLLESLAKSNDINPILNILKYNPRAMIPDLIEATGKGQRTISRGLNEYQEEGLLRREGSRKTGYWVVQGNEYELGVEVK